MANILVLDLGFVNVFLIKGTSYILIDTGTKSSYKKIIAKLKALAIPLEDIKLIILTHSHPDHVGSLDLMVQSTHAKVLMHQIEYDCLKGHMDDEIKPMMWLTKLLFAITPNKRAGLDLNVDILMDNTFDLKAYGVDGCIVHTPGHTKGSISVLLQNGDVIIGDSLMALMPCRPPSTPILAYDLEVLKNSLQHLIRLGAQHFYLSHGKVYEVKAITSAFEKLNKKTKAQVP